MFQRRRARLLLGLLVFASLVLVTVDFRGEDEGPVDRLRGVAVAVFAPVQDGVAWLVRPVGDAFAGVGELFSLRQDNARLRSRVAELEERRRTFEDLERENSELRGLLEMADRTELPTVAARTISLAPSNFEWTITIDAGREDGIDRNMPVIDGDGLVGRVIQVGAASSRVLLAIDPNFSVPARIASSGDVGTVDGRGGDPMLLSLLAPEPDLEVGDDVVTASYQGGIFPAGIPIGTVTRAPDPASGLSPEAGVSPFVDFSRLHQVLVVQSRPGEVLPPFDAGADDDEGGDGGQSPDARTPR